MERMKLACGACLVLLLMWVWVANIVFAIRHPWATAMERVMYLPTVMSFGTVDYDDARPRKNK